MRNKNTNKHKADIFTAIKCKNKKNKAETQKKVKQ